VQNWKPGWPTKDEYDLAMMKWQTNLGDPTLKSAQLSMNMGTKPKHYERGGLYAIVYKIGSYQARCFCSDIAEHTDPPGDIVDRYQKITRYIATQRAAVPALIETKLNLSGEGVYVSGRWWPVLKAEWLPSVTSLGSYIEQYHHAENVMRMLSDSWRTMARQLEAAQIAHGDLDITNVLVQTSTGQPVLRLIDYDNMWVPELANYPQTECGHEAFQHPAFFYPVDKPLARNRPYNLEMDRFSALVIYLSLLALSIRGSLFAELGAREDQRLLFDRKDYEHPAIATSRIQQVQSRCGAQVTPFVNELVACLNERRMPRALDAIATAPAAAAATTTSYPAAPAARPAPMAVPTRSKIQVTGHPGATGAPAYPSTPMVGYPQMAPPSSPLAPNPYAPPPPPGMYQQPMPGYPSPYGQTGPSVTKNPVGGVSTTAVVTVLVVLIIIAACILISQVH
jgi:hypothetical protein